MSGLGFHRLIRVLALALLVSAAVDLLVPTCCTDDVVFTDGRETLSSPGRAADAGHSDDDCFCCSRTVRTEPTVMMSGCQTLSAIAPALASALATVAVRPTYHPPQA